MYWYLSIALYLVIKSDIRRLYEIYIWRNYEDMDRMRLEKDKKLEQLPGVIYFY